MKKKKIRIFFIFCMSIVLLFLINCSSSKGGGSTGTGFPDVSDDNWQRDFEQLISFTTWGIDIISFIDVGDDSLKSGGVRTCVFRLNDIDIDLYWQYDSWWDDEEEEFYEEWYCYIDVNDLPPGIDLYQGSNISYYLEINSKTYQGNLEMPYEPDVNWSDFDFDENFTFDWEIEENPKVQLVWLRINAYDYDNEYYVDKAWELSGSKRSHSISKSYYQDYTDYPEVYFNVYLHPINYKNFGKCFVMALEGAYYDYGGCKGREKRNIDRKEILKRIIKSLDFKKKVD